MGVSVVVFSWQSQALLFTPLSASFVLNNVMVVNYLLDIVHATLVEFPCAYVENSMTLIVYGEASFK